MMNAGSYLRPYIPYNKFGIEIVHTGKNLANYADSTKNVDNAWNFMIGDIKANKNYSLYVNIDGDVSVNLKYYNNGNTELITNKNTLSGKNVINFHTTKDDILYFNGFERTEGGYNGILEIMLVEGTYTLDTIGKFEPYFKDLTTFVIDEPLRSLPNGVKDIAYLKDEKLYVERNIKKIILNGSETWSYDSQGSAGDSTVYGAKTLVSDYIGNSKFATDVGNINLQADTFKITHTFSQSAEGMNGGWGSYIYVKLFATRLSALNDSAVKTFFAENNTEVIYQLVTPIIEEYDDIYTIPMDEEVVDVYYVNDELIPNTYCKYYTIYAGIDGEAGAPGKDAEAPEVIKNVEGIQIAINDGKQINNFEIMGNSTQKTREGKNKFDINGYIFNGNETTHSISNLTLNVSGTYWCAQKIAVKQNTNYTISADTHTGDIRIYNGAIDALLSPYNPTDSYVTFNSASNDNIHILFYASGADTSFSNVQLEEGTTPTEYELYGVAPSPDYSSEIESIGYTNLFKPTLIADDGTAINQARCSVKIDKNTFKVTATGSDAYFGEVTLPTQGVYSGAKGYLMDVSNETSIAFKISNSRFEKNYITCYDKDLKLIVSNEKRTSEGIHTLPKGTHYISLRFGVSNSVAGETYETTVQIIGGSQQRPFISYGKYGVEVIQEGKNKIKPHIGSHTWNGLTGSYDPETDTFNVKGTTTATGGIAFSVTDSKFKLKKGVAYTQSVITVAGIPNMNVVPSVINSKNVITYNYFNNNGTKIPTEDLTINTYNVYINAETGVAVDWTFKVQFEEGSVATEYEPYRQKSVLLALDQPLRGFKDGVKDKAYIKQGRLYVERKVGNVIMDGDESFLGYSAVQGDYFLVQAKYNEALPVSYTKYLMSNYFRFKEN